ncbi:uncharacterized protein LOC134726408 [Mytilus trossulus]|uniref:uncharacterized protein LOC134726408 n=1 Tax=Mytilus trossulus TaxID=6551 RepID=UPI003006F17D
MAFTMLLVVLCTSLVALCEGRQKVLTLATLDTNSTQKFDTYVRREILFYILRKINETNFAQLSSSTECEMKINSTGEQCQQCLAGVCRNNTQMLYYQNSIKQIMPTIFKPVLEVSNFVDKMGKSLPAALGLLGEESGLFLEGLGQISSHLGSGLTGLKEFSGIASNLQSLGGKLTSLSKDVITVNINKLPEFGSQGSILETLVQLGAQSLLDQVKNSFSSIGDALTDLGNKVVGGIAVAGNAVIDTGNTIGNAFHSIFGKRVLSVEKRDCDDQCPVCGKIDQMSHDTMTILAIVCGEGIIYNQRNTLEQVKYLQGIYNNTIQNQLITKVEYDPLSIKTDHRIAFSRAFMTYSVHGSVDRFQTDNDFEISDLKKSAKDVAKHIWQLMN